MRFELFDQPVLILNSKLPENFAEMQQESLSKIEDILHDEITEIRENIDGEITEALDAYFLPFSIHLQTTSQICTVILESEWDAEAIESLGGENECSVSSLMRVLKIIYEEPAERFKTFKWLSEQSETFPYVHGFLPYDFILLPASKILGYMTSLRTALEIKDEEEHS